MTATRGRCSNAKELCTLAADAKIQEVPPGGMFACKECDLTLIPISAGPAGVGKKLAIVAAGLIAVAGVAWGIIHSVARSSTTSPSTASTARVDDVPPVGPVDTAPVAPIVGDPGEPANNGRPVPSDASHPQHSTAAATGRPIDTHPAKAPDADSATRERARLAGVRQIRNQMTLANSQLQEAQAALADLQSRAALAQRAARQARDSSDRVWTSAGSPPPQGMLDGLSRVAGRAAALEAISGALADSAARKNQERVMLETQLDSLTRQLDRLCGAASCTLSDQSEIRRRISGRDQPPAPAPHSYVRRLTAMPFSSAITIMAPGVELERGLQ